MADKVYCGKCRWIETWGPTQHYTRRCLHPKNVGSEIRNSWFCEYKYEMWLMSPEDRNAGNNCPLFEPEPFKPKWWERLLGITGYGLPHIDPNDIPPMPPVKEPKIDV